MIKKDTQRQLKRKQEIENRISNLEKQITLLERERREIINYLETNKVVKDVSE